MDRDALLAKLNVLAARVAELSSADAPNLDELGSATLQLNAQRALLDAHDAKQGPAHVVPAAVPASRSFATLATETGVFERALKGERGTVTVEGRDIFTGPGGLDVVTPAYEETIDRRPRETQDFLDLLPVRPTNSDTVVVYVQTGFTSAAKGVAKRSGTDYGTYAEAGITIERKVFSVVKVGHFARTDADSLADQGQLQSILEDELAYGVRQEIQRQLLADADTANGLPSLVSGAGTDGKAQQVTYSVAGDANADAVAFIEAIRKAKTAAAKAKLPVNFVALSPTAKEAIELAKNSIGQYIAGGPFAGGQGTIWGLSIVEVYALDAWDGTYGKCVVGSTRGITLYSRRATEVSVSDNVGEDWLGDALRIKASARLLLKNSRPEALVVVAAA